MTTINPNITNPTPKQSFQESSDNISKHREMIVSRSFERGIQYALSEYQLFLSRANPNEAMLSHFKHVGAQEFIAVLRNLAEKPQPIVVVPKPSDNLQGNVN